MLSGKRKDIIDAPFEELCSLLEIITEIFQIPELQLFIVYAIYCTYRYFHNFGLGWGICEGLISWFCDVFITMNSHILKGKFSRGLTHEIRENNHIYSISNWLIHSQGTMPAINLFNILWFWYSTYSRQPWDILCQTYDCLDDMKILNFWTIINMPPFKDTAHANVIVLGKFFIKSKVD